MDNQQEQVLDSSREQKHFGFDGGFLFGVFFIHR